jgi:hypothetical protein
VLSRPFWLSLLTGRTSALTVKLPRKEKFASEIFCYKPPRVILLQRDSAAALLAWSVTLGIE